MVQKAPARTLSINLKKLKLSTSKVQMMDPSSLDKASHCNMNNDWAMKA